MAYFLWIWQWLAPVFFFIGGFYLLENGNELILILGGVSAVIGLLVGIFGWGATVPPRWFWVKSASQLAGSRIMTSIGYAFQFFFIPAGIMGIVALF